MSIFQAIILGLVEGISEFLPISSTGHLILVSDLLGIKSSDFLSSFEIFIQLGAICSVIVLYFKRVLNNKKIFLTVGVAFVPAAIVGLLLYNVIKTYFLTSSIIVLYALFLGGIALIIFELMHKEKKEELHEIEDISYKQAVAIGIFQCFAVVPGVSRSAATILGGLIVGLKRKTIVEFSFLLAVPTMLAATALDLTKSSYYFNIYQWLMLGVGFLVSFVVAYISVKFLLKFVQNHTFIPFGIYRIVVALIFWLILLN